jgi:dihydrofolate reductase
VAIEPSQANRDVFWAGGRREELWSALTFTGAAEEGDRHMRNVVLWIGMSFDGFTSGVNERLDWLVPHATRPEGHAIFSRLRERCDTVLLGRVNYEGFLGYWPKVKDDPAASPNDVAISRWFDDVPKVVFSRTLREVKWKNARLAKGDGAAEVAALKREPGKDILIQNSTRLTQSLLAAGVVDELQIIVAPVVLGGGRALFSGLPHQIDLTHTETTPFDDGTFCVRYQVKRR